MKKKLLFLFFIVSFSAQAQTSVYHPFPDSGIFWREHFITGHGQSCCCSGGPCVVTRDYQYFLNGDTLIGAFLYKKIFKTGAQFSSISGPPSCPPWCTNGTWIYYINEYAGGLRQDTALRRVYYVPPLSSSDALLYDFNLNVGDTLPPSWTNIYYPFNYVASIDSILIGNLYHKRFNILPAGLPPSVSLIEGIGSTYGLLARLAPNFEDINTLVCVIVDSITVYPDTTTLCPLPTGINEEIQQQSKFTLFPNPATSQLTVTGNQLSENSTVEIYDVVGGKQIALPLNPLKGTSASIDVSSLAQGIYFVRVRTEKGSVTKKLIKQ